MVLIQSTWEHEPRFLNPQLPRLCKNADTTGLQPVVLSFNLESKTVEILSGIQRLLDPQHV